MKRNTRREESTEGEKPCCARREVMGGTSAITRENLRENCWKKKKKSTVETAEAGA